MIAFPPTRWSLIARLGGDASQAPAVVGLYAAAIAAYLELKLADEAGERRDDLIQEVLCELLARPDLLAAAAPGPGSRYRHYLMHLAWCAARNHRRHQRRRDHARLSDAVTTDDASYHSATATAGLAVDPAIDRAWAVTVIRHALDDLRGWAADGTCPAETPTVLERHLGGGEPLRTIAADLGISLATASRRLATARTLLQTAVADRLRLAGELADTDHPAAACDLLLAHLAR